MKLSIVYLILMWVWWAGAQLWIYASIKSENPKLLWVAGLYGLVMLLDGLTALAYQAQGQ